MARSGGKFGSRLFGQIVNEHGKGLEDPEDTSKPFISNNNGALQRSAGLQGFPHKRFSSILRHACGLRKGGDAQVPACSAMYARLHAAWSNISGQPASHGIRTSLQQYT